MKVLYNNCYGGFSFSNEFMEEVKKRYPELKLDYYVSHKLRSDPRILEVFEEFGSGRSSGPYSKIKVREIPDNVEYDIHDYDGMESVGWDIPTETIINDLLKILRKEDVELNYCTKMLLDNNLNYRSLREFLKKQIASESQVHLKMQKPP